MKMLETGAASKTAVQDVFEAQAILRRWKFPKLLEPSPSEAFTCH